MAAGDGKGLFVRVAGGIIVLLCTSVIGFCVNLNCRVSTGEIERAKMQVEQTYIQKMLDEISKKLDRLIENGRRNARTEEEGKDDFGGICRDDGNARG